MEEWAVWFENAFWWIGSLVKFDFFRKSHRIKHLFKHWRFTSQTHSMISNTVITCTYQSQALILISVFKFKRSVLGSLYRLVNCALKVCTLSIYWLKNQLKIESKINYQKNKVNEQTIIEFLKTKTKHIYKTIINW